MHVQLNLFHPESEGALPRVFLLQVQIRVEEDEVKVSLQVLQAPQQQLLTLTVCLTTFDLDRRNESERKRRCMNKGRQELGALAELVRNNNDDDVETLFPH